MSTEIMSIRENNQNTINQKQADLEAKKARLAQLNTEQQDLEATRQVR
jgi:hypothetical protein